MDEPEERNWGAEEWRAPDLENGDVLLFSECGRIIKAHTFGHDQNGIDYRSHYFRVVKHSGSAFLLVKHGGGQERIKLDYNARRLSQFLEPLDSSQRYLLMHTFFNIHKHATQQAEATTSARYSQAFTEGRLKKRKQRGTNHVKVWIEINRIK